MKITVFDGLQVNVYIYIYRLGLCLDLKLSAYLCGPKAILGIVNH